MCSPTASNAWRRSPAGARRAGVGQALGVLVEMGVPGGRTGARTRDEALAVARAVAAAPGLSLSGIECFEGILPDTQAVDAMLDDVLALAGAAVAEDLLPAGKPIVISAGGSAFYDRVGERFGPATFGNRPVIKVIRSGCYLTHDAIGYETAHQRILRETSLTFRRAACRRRLRSGPTSSPARSPARRS